jgi:holliday junction DNA helicase RuvA
MIAKITGQIISINRDTVVVETGGIGYEVSLAVKDLEQVTNDQQIVLWTHLQVSEDSWQLFGFKNLEDCSLFKILINVNGIGPKMGLKIINTLDLDKIRQAVTSSDPKVFRNISGIGPKNASRLIIELQDKLTGSRNYSVPSSVGTQDEDVIFTTLAKLGYTKQEINMALTKIDSGLSVEEKIKLILKNIGK